MMVVLMMLMMMTATMFNVDVLRLICGGGNEGFIYIMNPGTSFWLAVDGGENNKCLPQINNSGREAAKTSWSTNYSVNAQGFSFPLLLSSSFSGSLFDKLFCIWPKVGGCSSDRVSCRQRQSLVSPADADLAGCKRRTSQLYCERVTGSNEIPTQLNIWALCRWCPHK